MTLDHRSVQEKQVTLVLRSAASHRNHK